MRNLRLVDHATRKASGVDETYCLSGVCCSIPTQCGFSEFESSSVVSLGTAKTTGERCLVGFSSSNSRSSVVTKGVGDECDAPTPEDIVGAYWNWDGLALIGSDGSVHSVSEGINELVRDPSHNPQHCRVVTTSRSPDGDILVLSDSNAELIFLSAGSWQETRRWNLTDDSSLTKTEAVSVGWGSEKTQFKGTGVALAERLGKIPQKVDTIRSATHSTDSGETYLSWRGDGEYVAVSHLDSSGERILRVFDRRGDHLHSSSAGSLERCLAWQPSGSIIASSKHVAGKFKVVFFEKNCLPLYDFVLMKEDHDAAFVTALEWNSSSDVLCVALRRTDVVLQLWMRSNYHWDQKYSISWGESVPSRVLWDAEVSYRLHVFSDSTYKTWEWQPCVCSSNDEDDSWVAVASGNNLRLTPLGRLAIPPPMCRHELTIESPILEVVFGPSGTQFVCVADTCVSLCEVSTENGSTGVHTVSASYAGEKLSRFHSWAFVGEKSLVAATENKLHRLHLVDGAKRIEITEIEDEIPVFSMAGSEKLLKICDASRQIFQLETGRLTDTDQKLGALCRTSVCDSVRNLVFGLSSSGGKLFCYEWEIVRGATSVRIHGEKFLLVTTGGSDCWLWCLNLDRIKQEVEAGSTKASMEDLGVKRRAENGAKIVTSCVATSAVVLQMPRGNLETVYPRELLLSALAELLSKGDYATAYESMRRHRINLNVLCDHDPALFLSHVETFVEQVRADYIAQFLLDLTNEDVTCTLYKTSYGQRSSEWRSALLATPTCKVDAVCNTIRKVLLEKDEVKFMKPILAAFARCTDPQLGPALFFLANLRLTDEKLIDEGLLYLMYLVDADTLFDVALGTYDLKMAVMVAERSQRDPKEWVPFLDQFRLLESPYREYKIDSHLKKWHSALGHLAKCCKAKPELEGECLKLISEKGLFSAGLKLFERGTPVHADVCRRYAENLAMSGRRDEAGLIYALGGLRSDAARISAACGEEDVCSRMASAEEKTSLGPVLANAMANKRDFRGASRVALEWCDDFETSVKFLLEGRLWSTALHKTDGNDELNVVVKKKLVEFAEDSARSFVDAAEMIDVRTERLLAVFNAKFEEAMSVGDGENFPDVVSETETVASEASLSSSGARSVSNRSQRSVARRKKKEERKMRSLREGSRTEDLALVTWLHQAVGDVVAAKSDVRDALMALVSIDEWQKAKDLQFAFRSALSKVSFSCGKVWPVWLNQADLGLDENGEVPQHGQHFGPAATAADVVASLAKTASYRKYVRSRFMFMEPAVRFSPGLRSDFPWELSILAREREEGVDAGPRIKGKTDFGFV